MKGIFEFAWVLVQRGSVKVPVPTNHFPIELFPNNQFIASHTNEEIKRHQVGRMVSSQ